MLPDATVTAMHRRRSLLLIPLALALAVSLSSCSSSHEPDWEASQSQANALIRDSSKSASFLGAGFFHARPNEGAQYDERGVTLAYPEVRVDGIGAACFGDGEVVFGVTVRTGSSWTGIDPITLTCDSEVHTVPLSAPLERINAIRLNGGIEKGGGAVVTAVITGIADHI